MARMRIVPKSQVKGFKADYRHTIGQGSTITVEIAMTESTARPVFDRLVSAVADTLRTCGDLRLSLAGEIEEYEPTEAEPETAPVAEVQPPSKTRQKRIEAMRQAAE